ncbi:MAG: ATP-binding protein [Anaerolineae bacterium]
MRVWEVCESHPDVFARDMDPSMFAASLHAVETGSADPDYTEPERFFGKTFMTRSLENVLEGVLGRLVGRLGRGTPVLRLETPFGGGKTHTMVAVLHLARHAEAVEGTEVGQRLRQELNLQHLPDDIRLAVLDGVALDPQGRKVDGLTLRTLWGELAYRLGGKAYFEAVRTADEARTAPGQAVLSDLLGRAQPVLILMDELMHYLAKAQAVKLGDSNLAAQSTAFLRELTAAVGQLPRTVLMVSLPASSLEVPAQDHARAEEMFQSVHKVLGRTELIETPVSQDEVFGVLKRRLFRNTGSERACKQAVDAFTRYYQKFTRFFPEKLRSPAYRERMHRAYPFHPELVDLLYERWGPHPQFQRTRGALRLMALVLRRLWNQRPGSCVLIQPHHIDLGDRHIRAEVVRLLDGVFDAIVTGDVLGRSRQIDRDLGADYEREQLGQGAAACALLYSVSAALPLRGCTEEELRVALLRPEINPAQVSEVLGRLREQLWFFRYRDHRYFFTVKPNFNKVLLDFEQGVSEDQVEQSLEEQLAEIAGQGKGFLQVVVAPADAEALREPSRATLVLLPLRMADPEQGLAWMKRVVDRTTNRNLLVFLAPDKSQEGALRVTLRRWLALQGLQAAQMFQELEKEDCDEVKRRLKEVKGEIQGLLVGMYSRLYRPSPDGVEEVRVMLKRDSKTLAESVAAALKDKGILVESLAPEYLSQVLNVGQREVSLVEAKNVLTGSPGQPVLLDPDKALRQAISQGVSDGKFAVRAGGETFTGTVPEEVLQRPDACLIPAAEAVSIPQVRPLRTAATLKLTSGGKNLYPVTKVLELVKEHDVTVHLTVDDVRGELGAKRDELEKLLKDYAIPYEWNEQASPPSNSEA